jgi:hypothetical protein
LARIGRALVFASASRSETSGVVIAGCTELAGCRAMPITPLGSPSA